MSLTECHEGRRSFTYRYRDMRPVASNEALLREADMLEFLGMICIAREFAQIRLQGMEISLQWLNEESFGIR